MRRLIYAEWLKLATTRAPWAAVAGMLMLDAILTPIAMAEAGEGSASPAADARDALAMGPGVLTALVLLLLGALASAGEFHHRTVITTYLITPERGRVLTAKLVTHAALGAVVTAFGALISFPIVLLMASAADRHVTSTTHLVALSCTLVGTGALASMCGVAVGSILRHQTAAITLILLWTLLLEILFGGFFPPVLPFGSIIAADGLAGTSGPGVLQSLGVLGAWVCALSLLARHHSIRRDVT